jgi:hypothetical protein
MAGNCEKTRRNFIQGYPIWDVLPDPYKPPTKTALQPQGNGRRPPNRWVVELASLILRRSLGAVGHNRDSCSSCHRIPVAGELMHTFESGKVLCSLCVASLPEAERSPLRSDRVHVADLRLAVVPRAA